MIILLKLSTPQDEFERLSGMLLTNGCEIRETESTGFRVLFAERHWARPPHDLVSQLKASPWVESVFTDADSFPVISDRKHRDVSVGSSTFGAGNLTLIAGPCTIESEPVLLETAVAVKAAGASMLRGGAFKPTTSPYSYQGSGIEALDLLSRVGREVGLGVVSEVMDPRLVGAIAERVDMLQVGARNMQNFDLLREVGRQSRPVLLKRGMGSRIDEWLNAAEYVAKEGNENIVLCERGIRTFEASTRATLDVASITLAKQRAMLPVIVDPSHAAGERSLVLALALAAVAAGADGLMVEVHPKPQEAIKDGTQTIACEVFAQLARAALGVHELVSQSLTASC